MEDLAKLAREFLISCKKVGVKGDIHFYLSSEQPDECRAEVTGAPTPTSIDAGSTSAEKEAPKPKKEAPKPKKEAPKPVSIFDEEEPKDVWAEADIEPESIVPPPTFEDVRTALMALSNSSPQGKALAPELLKKAGYKSVKEIPEGERAKFIEQAKKNTK